jgi:hypothetical protein
MRDDDSNYENDDDDDDNVEEFQHDRHYITRHTRKHTCIANSIEKKVCMRAQRHAKSATRCDSQNEL